MKLNEHQVAEIMQVYEAYWDGYLKGDVKSMAALLHEGYTQVGSAETEVFSNKKDAVQFLYDTIDQVAGKLEMRNRATKLEVIAASVLIHELCDIYVLAEVEWIFYAKFRASTLMQKKTSDWKFIHQHSSFPDARTEEGQNIATKKIAEENLQLREAVKRRTVELEHKNRELEIEAALDRVRAAAMAMHKSEELPRVASVFLQQIEQLGIPVFGHGINIVDEEKESYVLYLADNTAAGQNQLFITREVPFSGFWYSDKAIKLLRQGKKEYTLECEGQKLQEWMDWIGREVSEERVKRLKATGFKKFYIHNLQFHQLSHVLFVSTAPLSEKKWRVLRRLTNTFGMSYLRFLDIQKAEAQAREAIKQASIDRVRGQIASMRSTKDLDRITPLIWNELNTLGVPFIRCGVFIMDEASTHVQAFLSDSRGKALAALNMPFEANPLTNDTVRFWRQGQVYQNHWSRQDFINWTQSLIEEGYISDQSSYQGRAEAPESLHLNFIPFTQGMLYVGNVKRLSEDAIDLIRSLANAFAIAYARYEDFVQLEQAKLNVESTLTELQATQKQLIQSEKMASLGELTAGIAHEIQNPLNFVNNFSQVSNELLQEMEEEVEAGNKEEIKEIMGLLSQNLTKITHHGERASGIVKGMLQHSRSNTGEKEPTDINALCDEYLRLAYHGVRAKNKRFKVQMETAFDETIGKTNVIPQDIGRVLLNLISNAFYAVNERRQKEGNDYVPAVTLSTRKANGQINIVVSDNGTGIPKDKIDKIFQPFFTTKPTGQGTGLGLSLSYDIVKAHGGELKVASEIGTGTRFSFSLPI